jgi:hypothetical protein
MTPEQREARVKELIDDLHLTPVEAEFTAALEEGEVNGDEGALDEHGNPVPRHQQIQRQKGNQLIRGFALPARHTRTDYETSP